MDEIDFDVVLNARLPNTGSATPGPDRNWNTAPKQHWENWTRGSQTVAERFDNRSRAATTREADHTGAGDTKATAATWAAATPTSEGPAAETKITPTPVTPTTELRIHCPDLYKTVKKTINSLKMGIRITQSS